MILFLIYPILYETHKIFDTNGDDNDERGNHEAVKHGAGAGALHIL